MSRLSPPVRALLFAAVALCCTGCLDFEKQTLVLKVTPDGKKAEMLLVYEGLRVQGDKEEDLKKAKEQLETLVKTQERFYLLTNWPFVVDLVEAPNDPDNERARKARFKKMLTIKNEGFFLDAKGKLGFWQTVRTSDAPKLLDEVNDFAVDVLIDQAREKTEQKKKNPGGSDVDDETLKIWANAGTTKPKVFTWRDGGLHLLIPASQPFAKKLQSEAATDAQAQLMFFAPNKIVLEIVPDGLHATAGAGGGVPLKLSLADPTKTTSADLNKQLLEYARTLPLGFKEGITADKLIADFVAK